MHGAKSFLRICAPLFSNRSSRNSNEGLEDRIAKARQMLEARGRHCTNIALSKARGITNWAWDGRRLVSLGISPSLVGLLHRRKEGEFSRKKHPRVNAVYVHLDGRERSF